MLFPSENSVLLESGGSSHLLREIRLRTIRRLKNISRYTEQRLGNQLLNGYVHSRAMPEAYPYNIKEHIMDGFIPGRDQRSQ
jgi:hypothetical protein